MVGSLASVNAGEWVTAEGRWVEGRELGLNVTRSSGSGMAPSSAPPWWTTGSAAANLGHRRENVEDHLVGRCGRVDGPIAQGLEPTFALVQLLHPVDQMPHRPTQPIQPPALPLLVDDPVRFC